MYQIRIIAAFSCLAFVFLSLNPAPSYAEGGNKDWSGAFGVNRVVQAKSSYQAVGGQVDISFYLPVDAEGELTDEVKSLQEKPSAYLGGSGIAAQNLTIKKPTGNIQINKGGTVETDAGLYFEITAYPSAPVGWVAFISVNGGFTNPRYWVPIEGHPDGGTSKPWRGSGHVQGEGSISASLVCDVTGGLEKLTILGATPELGTFFWNQNPNYADAGKDSNGQFHQVAPWKAVTIFTTAGIRPKRVVAMTRRGPNNAAYDELDGSFMRCTFKDCWLGQSESGWLESQADQPDETGYDAPGNGTNSVGIADVPLRSWDARWPWGGTASVWRSPNSHTIVEFTGEGVDNFLAREGDANKGNSSRYETETVNINLRRGPMLKGDKVGW